jgi:hypothetical protein
MQAKPGPPPSERPSDERGFSLLKSTDETAAQRRRRERPAEVGRYPLVLLGAVCAGAGAAVGFTSHARVSAVGLMLLGFGLILVALGAALHLVLLRDRDRWPESAHAWDEGIEIVLHDEEVKAALWTDPKLAIDLFVHRPRNASDDVRLLYWRMDSAVPPCDLSQEGFDRLMRVVASRDLRLAEYRSGGKGQRSRAYEIRAPGRRLELERMSEPREPFGTSP